MKKILKNIVIGLLGFGLLYGTVLAILIFAPPSNDYSLGGLNATVQKNIKEIQKK